MKTKFKAIFCIALAISCVMTSACSDSVTNSETSDSSTSHENSMENSSVINDNSSENSSVPDDSSSDSTSNEPKKDYSIISKDGENFIVFDNIEKYQNDNNAMVSATVDFPSMKAFKDAVTKGTLTDWQKSTIANNFKKDEDGKIFSCDFNNLFVPQIPKDSKIEKVLWYGGNIYSFELTSSEDVFGWLRYLTESLYNITYQREYLNLFERDNINVTATVNLDDNKVATYYSTWAGDFMNVRYSLTAKEKTFIVDKEYCLRMRMNNSGIKTSSDVPSDVKLYCVEGKERYVITLYGFVEEPTDDWLLSFGIEKFVDSE